MRKISTLFMVASAIFIAAPLSVVQGANWSYITLSNYYALPGQAVTVSGNGFDPGEAVNISMAGSNQAAVADGSGRISSAPFNIPFNVENSNVAVSATGNAGSHGSATLVVGTFYPNVVPSAWYVVPGGQVSFSGTNFAPGESVKISSGGADLGVAVANGSGSFSSSAFSVPYSGGQKTYSFLGQTSGVMRTVTITVAAAPPYVNLNNYYSAPGAPLKINGAQFGANEHVNINYNGVNLGTATTDASGTFAFDGIVPNGIGPGPQPVVVQGASTGWTAQTAFTPANTPNSGPTNSGASNPGTQPQIQVVSVDRIKQNLPQGQPTTITLRLISANTDANNVSVHVQLWNSNNNLVAEQVYAGQTLAQGMPQNYQLSTSPNLQGGNYTIASQVTDAGGNALASFGNLGVITVQ